MGRVHVERLRRPDPAGPAVDHAAAGEQLDPSAALPLAHPAGRVLRDRWRAGRVRHLAHLHPGGRGRGRHAQASPPPEPDGECEELRRVAGAGEGAGPFARPRRLAEAREQQAAQLELRGGAAARSEEGPEHGKCPGAVPDAADLHPGQRGRRHGRRAVFVHQRRRTKAHRDRVYRRARAVSRDTQLDCLSPDAGPNSLHDRVLPGSAPAGVGRGGQGVPNARQQQISETIGGVFEGSPDDLHQGRSGGRSQVRAQARQQGEEGVREHRPVPQRRGRHGKLPLWHCEGAL
mmetsp:Transcript_19171/g.72415  ORF Transcript_19171/g.72415 Transcript_19171/m.72415 type:complete len:290 (-) Transcript_19171:1430-2299(-)